jgi:predicted  nucleic acid-binding Zn-ribbon protein
MEVRNLFIEAKNVISDYKKEAEKLDNQERELKAELNVLQEEMTANLLDQEGATVSEMVYLRIQAKEINQRTEIIRVILEELTEERADLKLEFVPRLRSALGKTGIHEYNVTELVERYRYELLKEIADTGRQIRDQYHEIESDLMEVFDDSNVKEQYPRLVYQYGRDNFKPSFSWFNPHVISKNQVFYACGGSLPEGVTEPKEKDVE